jgi:hypothetical protein
VRRSRTLRVFVLAVVVDAVLFPLARPIGSHSSSCGDGGSGWWALLIVPWLVAPFAALIAAGVHDERAGQSDALGLAMGAAALVLVTHLIVFARMWGAAPSCGFLF